MVKASFFVVFFFLVDFREQVPFTCKRITLLCQYQRSMLTSKSLDSSMGIVSSLEVQEGKTTSTTPHQTHWVHITATHFRLELADPQATGDAAHKHHAVRIGLNARSTRRPRAARFPFPVTSSCVVLGVVATLAHAPATVVRSALATRRAAVFFTFTVSVSVTSLLAVTQLRLRLAVRVLVAAVATETVRATTATSSLSSFILIALVIVLFVTFVTLIGRVVIAVTATAATKATTTTASKRTTVEATASTPTSVAPLSPLSVHTLLKLIIVSFLAQQAHILARLTLNVAQFTQHRNTVQLLIFQIGPDDAKRFAAFAVGLDHLQWQQYSYTQSIQYLFL